MSSALSHDLVVNMGAMNDLDMPQDAKGQKLVSNIFIKKTLYQYAKLFWFEVISDYKIFFSEHLHPLQGWCV